MARETAENRRRWTFRILLDNGWRSAAGYAPVWPTAAGRAKPLAFDRPERWRSATPGNLEISHASREQTVKFVAATPEACDAVAEYALHLPAESLRNAVGVAFEVRVSAASPPYFDPSRITALKIGLALPKEGGAFWVRHFRVIYK
jgi:hypothetical protein